MASMTGDSLAAVTEIDFGSEGQVGITDNKRANVVEWYLMIQWDVITLLLQWQSIDLQGWFDKLQ